MKLKSILTALTLLFALALLGAEGWELDSDISFTITQSAFSDNWAGTELSNITWVANANAGAQKQMKEWLHNRNTLKLAFGQTHLQKTDALGKRYWEQPQKSTDLIDFESLFRFTLQAWVDPYLAGRFESQFLDESDPMLTRVVNPMLFTESAGVMKSFYDTESAKLSLRLGGAVRENVNRDVWVALPDERETQTTIDGGIEAVADFLQKLGMADTSFRSRLWVYQALFNSKSDELPTDDWKAADMKWENTLTTKLWSIVNAFLTVELDYEKQQIDELQWKQILGLGIAYSLF